MAALVNDWLPLHNLNLIHSSRLSFLLSIKSKVNSHNTINNNEVHRCSCFRRSYFVGRRSRASRRWWQRRWHRNLRFVSPANQAHNFNPNLIWMMLFVHSRSFMAVKSSSVEAKRRETLSWGVADDPPFTSQNQWSICNDDDDDNHWRPLLSRSWFVVAHFDLDIHSSNAHILNGILDLAINFRGVAAPPALRLSTTPNVDLNPRNNMNDLNEMRVAMKVETRIQMHVGPSRAWRA